MEQYTIVLTEEQCELIKNALGAYTYATNDVMSYNEIQARHRDLVLPILNQLPEKIF